MGFDEGAKNGDTYLRYMSPFYYGAGLYRLTAVDVR